jgi:PAS domain S-box-containing protein
VHIVGFFLIVIKGSCFMVNESELWSPTLSDVLQMMPSGLVALDRENRVRLWNNAMEKITGYSAEEVNGKSCSFLNCAKCAKSLDVKSKLKAPGASAIDDCDGLVENMECSIYTKSGEMIPILKNARVLLDDIGQAIGIVETITDLRYRKSLEKEIEAWRGTVSVAAGMGLLVGNGHKMRDVYDRIQLAAKSDATVLVHGDTGTGKELAANAIHMNSSRRDKPFIKLNCSALSESLLESELFGHVKGAFTGAVNDKIGRFEAANGGTIFMDEIGDISPLIQLKLLRVIQERVYERVGDMTPHKTDVRVIVATHRNLRELVNEGRFREDFYYRIKVFDIKMPSLMERKEDIPLLCNAFMERFRRATGKEIEGISEEVNHVFMDHCWPGNVRELENAIEHAFVTCQGGVIKVKDLPREIRQPEIRQAECRNKIKGMGTAVDYSSYTVSSKEEMIKILNDCGWNKAEVARRLGVERSTVWRRMKKWGIDMNAESAGCSG